jgi:hypothetical protein
MVALLLSAVAIMPVFGAVTGVVTVSKAYVAPGGQATVTVDDADLNQLAVRTNVSISVDIASAALTFSGPGASKLIVLPDTEGQTGTFGTGSAVGDEIIPSGTGFPLLKSVTAAGINGGATTTSPTILADFAVAVPSGQQGKGRVQVTYFGAATPGATTLVFDYSLATVDETTAVISSPSSPNTITITLTETGANTSKFSGPFNVYATGAGATTSDDVTDTLLAFPGDTITAKYNDASPAGVPQAQLVVESTKPIGVVSAPLHNGVFALDTINLEVTFTDGDSGVDGTSIKFWLDGAKNASGGDVSGSVTIGTPEVTVTAGGRSAKATLKVATPALDNTVVAIQWHATASDVAGNSGTTDSDLSTPTATTAENFLFLLDFQKPNFAGGQALAGAWFDLTTRKVVQEATKSKDTSIGIKLADISIDFGGGVVATAKESLISTTVAGSDFEVDGLKKADGTTTNDITSTAGGLVAQTFDDAPNWIFLTVPQMAPDAKPTVNLTGSISDIRGNAQTTGSVIATDNQAPTFTYTLDPASGIAKTSVKVNITANESSGVPVVTAHGATGAKTPVVNLIGPLQYQAEITSALVGQGLQSIVIDVKDSVNTTTKGSSAVGTDFPKSTQIAVYLDNALPAPSVLVNNKDVTGVTPPDIEANNRLVVSAVFTNEGKEYGLDGTPAIVNGFASVVTSLDKSKTVTIATLTIDDVSYLSAQSTQDNITFDFPMDPLAVGSHTLRIAAKDVAGNVWTSPDMKFTVIEQKPFKVNMKAGWNLISFPGTPVDTSIAAVFPSTHPATDVATYEDGQWLVAHRDSPSLPWEGNLTALDGEHAYFVRTTSTQPVEALLMRNTGGIGILPTVNLEQGWNLVPVIDLSQATYVPGFPAGTRTVGTYFASLNNYTAYTFDATGQAYNARLAGGDNLPNGTGVWVYVPADATLVP